MEGLSSGNVGGPREMQTHLRDGRGRLSGGLRALRLELVQVIDRALCVGGGLEDRPVVVLQNGEPGGDVGSVVLTDFRGEFKVCAKERGAQFGDEYWSACDTEARFPEEFYRAMADGGWLGITMPEALGGSGMGVTEAACS